MITRLDNIGIIVEDLDGTIAFFRELGLELEGRAEVSGDWADRLLGIEGMTVDMAMMRTPDGGTRLELSRFLAPDVIRPEPADAPVNTLGLRRLMFEVDDLDATVARMTRRGATLAGEIVNYENVYRLCYLRGPEGILIALAQDLR